ncbi:hypothetical protein [Anianabacter salinae]|uniref:hypothetical protein n=1 Tax=Anianabacter salinae TaxID=2851023 RepID=UPI00225DD872|nr:hypothetical protein [Anianabacter salinae]MBV0913101.1 hypothetical protein [Anianabacter salinae]
MKYLAILLCAAAPALAGEAVVVDAAATAQGDTWRFDVSVRHADEGWDHYAGAWAVELEDGTVVGTRELLHPHVDEQPFTRSLGGVMVPEGTATVYLRARDTVHGWSGGRLAVPLER